MIVFLNDQIQLKDSSSLLGVLAVGDLHGTLKTSCHERTVLKLPMGLEDDPFAFGGGVYGQCSGATVVFVSGSCIHIPWKSKIIKRIVP